MLDSEVLLLLLESKELPLRLSSAFRLGLVGSRSIFTKEPVRLDKSCVDLFGEYGSDS
jgi:hypothetical protein